MCFLDWKLSTVDNYLIYVLTEFIMFRKPKSLLLNLLKKLNEEILTFRRDNGKSIPS